MRSEPKHSSKKEMTQRAKFENAAREHEADESEERFDERLKRVAKSREQREPRDNPGKSDKPGT